MKGHTGALTGLEELLLLIKAADKQELSYLSVSLYFAGGKGGKKQSGSSIHVLHVLYVHDIMNPLRWC